MASATPRYIGRFAPSPTGPLHFGSLVSALASFLDARQQSGRWLLRIEDLDPPREDPASPDEIMKVLEEFGLVWDGAVLFQSTRLAAYEAAIETLAASNAVFPCTCSRKTAGVVYPGTCRNLPRAPTSMPAATAFALRVKAGTGTIHFIDRIAGAQTFEMATQVGDFIVKRKDGLHAYQLAVTVDDAFQGVTHVVRGSDLLDSTPRQIHLQHLFGWVIPSYAHHGVITGRDGHKLSKQAKAPPIAAADRRLTLGRGLAALGLNPPDDLSLDELLDWGILNWRVDLASAGSIPEAAL